MRHSRQRQLIYEAVADTKTHPDALWVYDKVRIKIPDISLGTVYRNLKLLTMAGKIVTVESEENELHYDADISSHNHFICNNCRRIYDIYDCPPPPDLEGFEIQKQKTVYYGLCSDCKK